MANIFDQQGITYDHAPMASTAPSGEPDAIKIPQVSMSELQSAPDKSKFSGNIPLPSAPENVTAPNLAVSGTSSDAAAPEDAPPPARAASAPRNIFNDLKIDAPTIEEQNADAFQSGVPLGGDKQLQTTPDQQEAQQYMQSDRDQALALARSRFPAETIKGWENNPITFSEAFTKLHAKQVVPLGGLVSLYDSADLVRIAEKKKAGEDLTPEDQNKLNSFLDEHIEQTIRGFSWGGNIAYVGSQIPAFALEFAATAGYGKAAQIAAVKGAEKLTERAVLKTATGIAARIATTTALMPGQYAGKYGERRVNDIMAVTDKGNLVLKDSEESPATSALLAFTHTAADVTGQISAGGFSKYVVDPITKAVSTPLVAAINKLPVAVKDGLYQAYKAIQPNAQVSKVFTAAGWRGMIEQLGANRVTQVLNSTLDYASDKKATFDEYLDSLTPSKDQLLTEGGLIAIGGAIHTSASVAANLMKSKGVPAGDAHDAVNNMTALERDNYVQQNLPTPIGKFQQSEPINKEPIQADQSPLPAPQTVYFDGEVGKNQLASAEAKDPPPINDSESMFNSYYRAMHHDAAAAEIPYKNAIKAGVKVDRLNNTQLLIALNHQIPSMVDIYTNKATFRMDENGHPQENGKALKATMDDFDNYFMAKEPKFEERRKDFNDFLLARHYEALQKHATDIIVTDEQKVKSAADMQKLKEKYGEDYKMLETFGDEFVQFRKRTRDLLVGTLLTKKQRDLEDKRYPYSIPLKREITPEEHSASLASGDYAGLNPGSLTKRLKGSALPVKDIVESTLRETARTIDFVMRNRVGNSIYNLREHAPDQVQVTQRPSVLKGTAEFQHSFDPKLRAKLEKAAEFLGGSVTRSERIKDSPPGTHGAYSPMENLIMMRLGSTEGTLAHEVGHVLDHNLKLTERMLKDDGIRKELQNLAEDRLNGEFELEDTLEGVKFTEAKAKAGAEYVKYIKSDPEILANFYDAYVNSPEQVEDIAPNAKAAFEALIEDNPQLAFLKDIKPSTNRGTETIKKEVFGKGDIPPNTFPFWKDGRQILLKVSKPMFESLSSMRPSQLNVAEQFFYKALRIGSGAPLLRYGATTTPEFTARNVVKDALEATVQSGVKFNPTILPRAIYGVIFKNKDFQQFVQSGGKFGSYMPLDDANIEGSFADILKPKSHLRKLLSNPMEAIEYLPKTSDVITRYGVYLAAVKQGYSPIEGAHYAVDATLQFPRGGTFSKKVNRVIPFFNVGLLATEKLVRAFKEDPQTMALRGLTYLTTPALVISGYYLYGADDETKQAWMEIPIDRITSGQIPFNYNKETGEWSYIPTPYALGYMFSGLPMLTMRQVQKDAPDDGRAMWQHLMKGFAGSISPINDWSSVIPPSVKVALEDTANFDYFRGREIYSKYKEGDTTLASDKSNSYDSETAKLIGQYFNHSPALIDHDIRGLAGGLGGYGLDISDAAINGYRRYQGQEVPEKPTSNANVPLVKGFTIRAPEGKRSNSFAQMQKHYEETTAIFEHHKDMPSGPEKAQYQADNQQVISQHGQLNAAYKRTQEITKQISKIYDDVHMSGDDKAQRIRVLEKEITQIARQANSRYNSAVKQGE